MPRREDRHTRHDDRYLAPDQHTRHKSHHRSKSPTPRHRRHSLRRGYHSDLDDEEPQRSRPQAQSPPRVHHGSDEAERARRAARRARDRKDVENREERHHESRRLRRREEHELRPATTTPARASRPMRSSPPPPGLRARDDFHPQSKFVSGSPPPPLIHHKDPGSHPELALLNEGPLLVPPVPKARRRSSYEPHPAPWPSSPPDRSPWHDDFSDSDDGAVYPKAVPSPPPTQVPASPSTRPTDLRERVAGDRTSTPVTGTRPSLPRYDVAQLNGRPEYLQLPGAETHGYSGVPSPEVPYLGHGKIPNMSDSVKPDDSRSETGQIRVERLRPPSGMASVTAPSYISQRPSSSGTLGAKGYQYDALQEREIRLVKILKATMSTIKCEIHRASLDPPPDYTAISYTWGDADDTRQIVLVEEPPAPVDPRFSDYRRESIQYSIPVAASLHGALGALRKRDRDVYVWVDALCIDQQNRDERAQQVKLMTSIYKLATSVAIWLGPEADESHLAMSLLEDIATHQNSPEHIKGLITNPDMRQDFAATVSLFERDYWNRLWIIQEVFNAQRITVHCGERTVPWSVYKSASKAFWYHKSDLDRQFPRGLSVEAQNQYSLSQVLGYQGPNSIPDTGVLKGLGDYPLLGVMCLCRRKLSADARDKVFGILGVLPEAIRMDFPVNYSLSVKEVYVGVVDSILFTTQRLDVICESIHYPPHTSSANLPSWCPDWSHVTETSGLARLVNFSASGSTVAKYKFLDEPRRRQLQIRALFLDKIRTNGIAVGTLCTTSDYLMAFLHWRALFLDSLNEDEDGAGASREKEDAFCRTLCLDQLPEAYNNGDRWLKATYHVFASLLNERLPKLRLDSELKKYVTEDVGIPASERRSFLHQHFKRMMGRTFCLTSKGHRGLGTGFMTAGDFIVVPYGCSTPIILRPEGRKGEFRFVGDVYVHGYMKGEALDLDDKKLREQDYILH